MSERGQEMARQYKKWLTIILSVFIIAFLAYYISRYLGFDIREYPAYLYISTFLNWAFKINIVLIAIFIFMENRNPSRTVSWLLILSFLPVFGFLLYILLGRTGFHKPLDADASHSESRFKDLVETQRASLSKRDFGVRDGDIKRMQRLILQNAAAPLTEHNRVEIYVDGLEAFPEMLAAMANARHHIHLIFFIVKQSDIANEIKDLLIKKAQQGVKVRFIYDAVGSWRLPINYLRELRAGGVQILPFHPIRFPFFSRDLNHRNHRKITIIDGKIAFFGGLNIAKEYLGLKKRFGYWRDTHLKVEGESVSVLQAIFAGDWKYVSGEEIPEDENYYPPSDVRDEGLIQIVPSGPDDNWEPIMQAYFQMIVLAENRAWIASPYLVPNSGVLLALETAALSGVDVRILLPQKLDHFLVYYASQDNFRSLMLAGVKIYRYQDGFMHSKVVIVDDFCASAGTANMDHRSLEHNYEVNGFFYDPEMVQKLEEDFIEDFKHCTLLTLEDFAKRPIYQRIFEALGRLFSPLQ